MRKNFINFVVLPQINFGTVEGQGTGVSPHHKLMTIRISIYHSVSPSALHPKKAAEIPSHFFLRIYSQVKIKLWGTI